METFREIGEIEAWFPDDWDEKWIGEFPYYPEIWLGLSILDIIRRAFLNKTTAYTAYYNNIQKFAQFCNTIWETNQLDLRNLPQTTSEEMRKILKMFPATAIIFPPHIPNDTLDYINHKISYLTFYLKTGTTRLYRSKRIETKPINLHIIGDGKAAVADPTIDILMAYTSPETLTLENVYITENIIETFRNLKVTHLHLKDCSIEMDNFEIHKRFVKILKKSQFTLKTIEINSKCTRTWLGTITEINNKIKQFTSLITYKISFEASQTDMQTLFRQLDDSPTLKHLHLINIRKKQANYPLENPQDREN